MVEKNFKVHKVVAHSLISTTKRKSLLLWANIEIVEKMKRASGTLGFTENKTAALRLQQLFNYGTQCNVPNARLQPQCLICSICSEATDKPDLSL